jgi:hypothetical protein
MLKKLNEVTTEELDCLLHKCQDIVLEMSIFYGKISERHLKDFWRSSRLCLVQLLSKAQIVTQNSRTCPKGMASMKRQRQIQSP